MTGKVSAIYIDFLVFFKPIPDYDSKPNLNVNINTDVDTDTNSMCQLTGLICDNLSSLGLHMTVNGSLSMSGLGCTKFLKYHKQEFALEGLI